MAENALISTIEIKNVSPQLVFILVKPQSGSPIFNKSGNIALKPDASLEAEDNRFDLAQIRSIQDKKIIEVNKFRRLISASASIGSSGSA
jgi:hypothetical protein